jgi:NitT/TauT family transport system ATP-binding protein
MQMIKVVGLDRARNKMQKYPTLSGGQLQRVAIARLLVNQEILLMDELLVHLILYPFKDAGFSDRHLGKSAFHYYFGYADISEAVYWAMPIYIMSGKPVCDS